jgi:phytanoyl-CoA hydroxylase
METYHEPDYKEEDFVPIEMERGSLAIFAGHFWHKSHANTSEKSRYAYTWHLMDSRSKWSPENWLQRAQFPKFPIPK